MVNSDHNTSLRPRRQRWLWLLLLLGVLLVASAMVGPRGISAWKRKQCANNLRALAFTVTMYRDMHDNMFPSLLGAAVLEQASSSSRLLVCPGTGNEWGSLTDADRWMDYLYINWSRYYGTNAVPGGYPLIYDRHLSNHKGQGVNIAFVDGSVRWDSNATWLREFLDQHPQYEIPLPQ